MPRPQRCRRICREPEFRRFAPEGANGEDAVCLSLDEFEAIRLVDHEGKNHQECALSMGISRTTATEIYQSAREKIASSIVLGKPLIIEGGSYCLCDGSNRHCSRARCNRDKDIHKNHEQPKGENITMKIAVTYQDGNIFQHFGHTAHIKLYVVEQDKIVEEAVLSTNGSGHGALAGFLEAIGADVLICGGIGGGAQMALAQKGIKLFGGVSGSADEAVKAFIAGNLEYNADVRCSHHDHEHGEGHQCGDHGCGSHTCGDHGCHS